MCDRLLHQCHCKHGQGHAGKGWASVPEPLDSHGSSWYAGLLLSIHQQVMAGPGIVGCSRQCSPLNLVCETAPESCLEIKAYQEGGRPAFTDNGHAVQLQGTCMEVSWLLGGPIVHRLQPLQAVIEVLPPGHTASCLLHVCSMIQIYLATGLPARWSVHSSSGTVVGW